MDQRRKIEGDALRQWEIWHHPADIEKFAKPTQKAKKAEPATNTNLIDQMTTQIDRQVEEIAFLRDELSKQRDEQSEQSKRHDTIVLHMTQQLDRAQLQLEDKQNTTSLWQRLKTVFQKDIRNLLPID